MGIKTIKIIDIISHDFPTKEINNAFGEWLDDSDSNNDSGKFHYIEENHEDSLVYEKIINDYLRSEGCVDGEKIMFYVSW